MKIEIICTGDEVLSGKIVNSNFAYISQKLEDFGLSVRREVTVGDDRADLLTAFREAGERADAVIVNGGLGPTVDDLSQEVAAEAAGLPLELNEEWLERMRGWFLGRGRKMPDNNRKQAMLPQGAEVLDNPLGTACGFAVNIGRARFYFTPGVPRELFRMLEEGILPRLLGGAAATGVIRLRRFHSYGLGESHVDHLLADIEEMAPDGSVKLGFRAHYPQLETKLTIRANDDEEVEQKAAPIVAEIRRRLGNFIMSEGDQTVEGVIMDHLAERGATLAIAEDFTGGQVAARLAPLPQSRDLLLRGTVAPSGGAKTAAFGAEAWPADPRELLPEHAETLAHAARAQADATIGLAVLVTLSRAGGSADAPAEGEATAKSGNLNGSVCIAVVEEEITHSRRSRLSGNRDWVRLGAMEMALDSLRRVLQGLSIKERSDFDTHPAENN